MLISSIVTVKIAYALAKDMVNFEAAKRLAPNLIDSSKRWLMDTIQKQSGQQETHANDEEAKKNQDSVSTEYLVHNWLEAMFAWFQVVVLWHEPLVSLGAISGLLSWFLLLTYFAPRFYATILIVIFVFNLYKFWFRHVWPEIRVPPGRDREDELRLDVDRWTYLHPQLMTLAELNQNVGNLTRLGEKYLSDLLEMRQRKPLVFCSMICSVFMCTAFIGNTLSGMCLIFIALIILMTAPGIYVHLLPDNFKQWLRHSVGQKLFGDIQSESSDELPQDVTDQGERIPLESTSGVTSRLPKEFITSSLSSTTKSIEQLFETLKQRSFPIIQTEQQTTRKSSSSSTTMLIREENENDDDDDGEDNRSERTKLIDIPLGTTSTRGAASEGVDGANIRSRHNQIHSSRRRSSDTSDVNDESVSLIESDDDQQDGFVML